VRVATPLVRNGCDHHHPPDKESGKERHTFIAVHSEMLAQICADYSSLPDPRTLSAIEIRWFYENMRKSLHEATKPRKTK